jgi:hypothetical protein
VESTVNGRRRPRFRRLQTVLVGVMLGMALATSCAAAPPRSAAVALPTVEDAFRPFSLQSPLNVPIGPSPRLDPASDAMIGGLADSGSSAVADLYEFGFGVYDADASTPRHTVSCRMPWGVCPFDGKKVPLSAEMVPPRGSDGQIAVIDWATRTVWEMWQYDWRDGAPITSWGGYTSLDGAGFTRPPDGAGGSRGSGFSVLAGVVRLHEIEQGNIPHALEFSTSKCQEGVVRPPAHTTDGRYVGSDAIPEGARVQLDPALDLDAVPGITPAEKTIGRALQIYGAFAVDCGGSPMAIGFEMPGPGETNSYPAAGLTHDYFELSHIPVDSLRVLAAPSPPA